MNRNIIYCLLLIAALSFSTDAWGQKKEGAAQSYADAEEEYNIGHFEEADSILSANISNYSSTQKAGAYRLKSLCALFMGDREKAKRSAQQMFDVNPYYTASVHDPIQFVDLVEELKQGGARVSTASQQAETLDEVPVPVTLITEDMIKASGARSLQDLLLLYVPGMSLVEGPETNVAMHGVYSVAQEKILIMLDGHRLNSRCTNAEAPDYRTSLDKIKQIEVLRGPASSLYGNVALTAVVNIITKKGHEMDGARMTFGYGSNNTMRADFTMGKSGVDMSFSMWASIYNSDGEKRKLSVSDADYYSMYDLPNSYMYINGFNHIPSFDIGFSGQYKDFSAMVNMQGSKRVSSYSQIGSSQLYDYDSYRIFDGNKPGRSRKALHLDLTWEKSFGNLSVKANAFADFEKCTYYDIITDSLGDVKQTYNGSLKEMLDSLMHQLVTNRDLDTKVMTKLNTFLAQNPALATILAQLQQGLLGEHATDVEWIKDTLRLVALDQLVFKRGIYQVQNWEDRTVGGSLQASYVYDWGKLRGNILGGLQVEHYKLKSSQQSWGDGYTHILATLSANNNSLDIGTELSISPFLQLKSYIGEKLIFNGGLRYDYKRRYNDRNLQSLSPRVSFIYLFNRDMNIKLGYARSFVDAPYFYRANKLGAYPGSESLEAETMHAIQLDFNWNIGGSGLMYEANAFYNRLSDLIVYSKTSDSENGYYLNAGRRSVIGLENSLTYAKGRSLGTLNLSWQSVVRGEETSTIGHYTKSVPALTATAMYRYLLMSHPVWGGLFLRGNATFYSKQKSPIEGYAYKGTYDVVVDYDNEVKARLIANIGADYTYKIATLSLDCYNLFGTHYVQGGSNYVPVPQEGRSIMAKLSLKL